MVSGRSYFTGVLKSYFIGVETGVIAAALIALLVLSSSLVSMLIYAALAALFAVFCFGIVFVVNKLFD